MGCFCGQEFEKRMISKWEHRAEVNQMNSDVYKYFPPLVSNMLRHILQMKVSFIYLLKTQLLHSWKVTQLWCQMRHQNAQQGTEHRALVNVPIRIIIIKSTPEQIFKSVIHPFHIIHLFFIIIFYFKTGHSKTRGASQPSEFSLLQAYYLNHWR